MDADAFPVVGLGTFKNTDPEGCADTVATALEMGYRHVDTATFYENEAAVGEGIRRADVPRKDVAVATKLWLDELAPEAVREHARESLERLGLDAVDVCYVHWPAGDYDPAGTLAAFDELYDDGLIDAIGVSNFTPELLEEALALADAPIVANQVECHPLLPQDDLRAFCDARDVQVVAYSPFVHGDLFDVPELQAVADQRDASVAQVALAWFREKDVAGIPKASSEPHLRENYESRHVELTDDDVAVVDGIDRRRRIGDPGFAPDW